MKPYPWIKLSTDFFEDPKILRLKSYPESEFLFTFWIKLVLLSVRRTDGLLMIDENIPYSVNDFKEMFPRQSDNTIRMALSVFEKLNMIVVQTTEIGETILGVSDFVGFVDVESLELDRHKNRKKQADFRERQKNKLLGLKGLNEVEIDPQKSIIGANIEENNRLLTGDSPVSNQKITGQNRNRTEEDKNRTEEKPNRLGSVVIGEEEEFVAIGFASKEAKKLINQYGTKKIQEVVEYALEKGAKNIPAYVNAVLRNMHGPDKEDLPKKQDINGRKGEYLSDLEAFNQLDYRIQQRLRQRKELGNIGSDHNFPDPIWLKKALAIARGG